MMFKTFMNLIVAPMGMSVVPSIVFWYFGIFELEWWKCFVVFVVLRYYKDGELIFY